MSIVNLTSTILTPDYSAVYMAKSAVMDEAIRRGGCFHGFVGSIETSDVQNQERLDLLFRVEDSGRTSVK